MFPPGFVLFLTRPPGSKTKGCRAGKYSLPARLFGRRRERLRVEVAVAAKVHRLAAENVNFEVRAARGHDAAQKIGIADLAALNRFHSCADRRGVERGRDDRCVLERQYFIERLAA